jgi:endoglucanase
MNRPSMCRALQTVALLLLAGVGSNAIATGYSTQGGKIHDPAGQEVQIRGISHFGFNSTILQPEYLWSMGWKQQIAQIKSLGFNAIRVPFVPDTLFNTTPVDKLSGVDAALNPELLGKTPLQVLDLWMAEADRQGMYILLDFHSVSMQRQYPTWFVSNAADFGLIYNNQAYTQADWIRDLVFVAQRYANLPHFFAIDIYNEPNGIVRWSTGDPNDANPIYFWKAAAEAASAAVLTANPNLLIFVQGINGNFDGVENSAIPMNWGEDFQPEAYQPLGIPVGKLVLTPHTYGPDVFMKSTFSATNFPANLAANWDALFGQFSQVYPVVVGEWGGQYGQGPSGQLDVTWQNAFVTYLLGKGISNSFYWCYTPNSGDTGGILDANLNVRLDKMALLQRLWGAAPAAPPTYAQPTIRSFVPNSGPAGTVVTLNGSGFTGVNSASVGPAKNAPVSVDSDTQVRVTIPATATTGNIGVQNPAFSALSGSAFAVTDSAAPPATGTPPPATVTAPASASGGGGTFSASSLIVLILIAAMRAASRRRRVAASAHG